jgi:hypothetical protein
MSYGPLDKSKATPSNHASLASYVRSGLNGARRVGQGVALLGKAVANIPKVALQGDEFTNSVSRKK